MQVWGLVPTVTVYHIGGHMYMVRLGRADVCGMDMMHVCIHCVYNC